MSLRSPGPILGYHGIGGPDSFLTVREDDFAWQMAYLARRGFRVLTLSQWAQKWRQGMGPGGRAVVITFDDGLASVWERAAPILERHGFCATVFPVTGYLGKHNDWEGRGPAPALPLMSWAEIRALARDGHELAPHSHSHPRLPELPEAAQADEIACCRRLLEERLGRPVPPLFCYPHGRYDTRTTAVLRRLGFEGAVTTALGWNPPGQDPLAWGRIVSRWFRRHRLLFALFLEGFGSRFLLGLARHHARRRQRPAGG
ncbi:MAG: polysaccharide deacetylase family protein [Thermodesulfobacteriota bacterium]